MQNCTCVVDADAGIAAEDMGVDAYDYEDLDYRSWNWNGSEWDFLLKTCPRTPEPLENQGHEKKK